MPFNAMEHRLVGSTTAEMQLLGLGTVPLGGWPNEISEAHAFDMLQAAWDAGVRTFDTAPLYGCGLAEERLGAFLRDKPREDVIISSKVGRLVLPDTMGDTSWGDARRHCVFDFSYDGIMKSVDASLARLGIDRLDILLLHDPDAHLHEAHTHGFKALDQLRRAGAVTAIGAGMNQNPALCTLVSNLDLDIVLLAGRYTLLDQSALRELLPICDRRGTSVMIGGVFNSGVLNDPRAGAHFDYLPLTDQWRETALSRGARTPEAHETAEYWLSRAQSIKRVCDAHQVPIQAAALQFAAAHPLVSSIVVGAGKPQRFAQNIAALEVSVPHQLWLDLIDAELIPAHSPLP